MSDMRSVRDPTPTTQSYPIPELIGSGDRYGSGGRGCPIGTLSIWVGYGWSPDLPFRSGDRVEAVAAVRVGMYRIGLGDRIGGWIPEH